MSLGPVMLGISGLVLTAEERSLLRHPRVGGVILFSRNYQDPEQVTALIDEIHQLRQPRLLVAVDQEGGRVQRLRDGFTRLPPVRRLGEVYDADPVRARKLARISGWLMASELRSVGIDFSFAPVLDLDYGCCPVIGNRAFHRDPYAVSELALAYATGMHQAGMEAVGKHFPGHGGVSADSHLELPVDPRPLTALLADDLIPFERLIGHGLAGIMPAHVLYPEIDDQPAGFSARWLSEILRGRFGFQGAIFSDDLDMAGAAGAGGPLARAHAALAAGCDLVLACNDREAALAIVEGLDEPPDPAGQLRLTRLHGREPLERPTLLNSEAWREAVRWVESEGQIA